MPVDATKPTHQIKVLDLGDIHGVYGQFPGEQV